MGSESERKVAGKAADDATAASDRDAEGETPALPDVGALGRMVGYALRRAQLTVFDEVIANFAELDLRPAQYSVLVLLGRWPGLKQSDVAAALGIQRANFVVLFDGLERRALARRSPAPNDRRSYALYLTEAGAALLRRANQLEAELEARLDVRLGPGGREQLLDLLGRLVRRSPLL
jgi:DNA-binding MarR family transcriptional regulator